MRHRIVAALGYFGVWTLIGLFFGSQAILYSAYSADQPWQRPMLGNLADWYLWAALAPLIRWLGKRFPLTRGHRRKSVPVLAVASLVLTVFKIVLRLLVGQLIPAIPTMKVQYVMLSQFHLNLATFWAILGIGAAFDYYRRYRERELRASQLESLLSQAQLQALRAQLQPHFLFNTLHTISALIQEGDIEGADRMIARLGELLRLATDTAQAQEVPLRQELEFLQRYLDIQHVRFHDRLRVRIEIGDETLGAKVPSLMLQPLVENAIRHGISPRASGGTVTVTARQVGNELRMEIEDDGMGLHPTAREGGSGVGLANTRARLEQLYGDDHRFAVESRTDGGTRVSLVMPFVQT